VNQHQVLHRVLLLGMVAYETNGVPRNRPERFATVFKMLVFSTGIGICGVKWSELGITEVLMPGRSALKGADARGRG